MWSQLEVGNSMPSQMNPQCFCWNSHYELLQTTLVQHQHQILEHEWQFVDKNFHRHHLSIEAWTIGIVDYPILNPSRLKYQGDQSNLSQQLYHFLPPYCVALISCYNNKKQIITIGGKANNFIASCGWERMCSNFSHK